VQRWVNTHRESKKPFVLAMLDIDDFKEINDAHGHQVGDRVLFCAAQWFQKYIRSGDFLARYGGEEFVIMLENADPVDIESRLTDMLVRMSGCSYEYEENGQICVLSFTSSCGLAEFTGDESADELLRRADEALYVAKRTGKNRVVLAKKSKSWWKTLKPFKRGGTDRQ
jgi:diguanylate cyclase (GGDEF)-like protein